jgi:hypothetical protein
MFTALAGEVIGHLGGVQDILVALRTHPNDAKLCSTCLSALWGLTVHGMYPVLYFRYLIIWYWGRERRCTCTLSLKRRFD